MVKKYLFYHLQEYNNIINIVFIPRPVWTIYNKLKLLNCYHKPKIIDN